MTKDELLLNFRISLLKKAKAINNISRACRELRINRSTYYKYLKRYLAHGKIGLYDKKRVKPKMPNETRKEIVDKILNFVKKYLTYGLARIANELDSVVCSATIY